ALRARSAESALPARLPGAGLLAVRCAQLGLLPAVLEPLALAAQLVALPGRAARRFGPSRAAGRRDRCARRVAQGWTLNYAKAATSRRYAVGSFPFGDRDSWRLIGPPRPWMPIR